MSRNGSGVYATPNTFAALATITASGFNQNFSDLASEITNSLAADGQTSMIGPIKAATGAADTPSYTFSADTNTGFYRADADQIGVAVGGVNVATFTSTGISNFWTTGDAKLTLKTVADVGWIMINDGTIGSASSGATTRAHEDVSDLYTLVWNGISDTYAPVTGGRGANAAADFAANKPMAMPKALGRALIIAGTGATLTARALGQTVGAETHALITAELAAHSHGVNDPGHSHSGQVGGSSGNVSTGGGPSVVEGPTSIGANYTGISIQNAGSGVAHNNMQPSSAWNIMVKL